MGEDDLGDSDGLHETAPTGSNQVDTRIPKTMWAIHPGEVRARDGDRHFISYEQLIRLYGVHPTMCVKARDGWDRAYNPEFRQQFVHLYPRQDGKYQVNGLVNLDPDTTAKPVKSAKKETKRNKMTAQNQPSKDNDNEGLRAELEKLEVPKMVIWVDKEMKVETTNLTRETVDEILALFAAHTKAIEREARIDEHKQFWSIVPSGAEHIGTLKDISALRVIKLEAQRQQEGSDNA